MSLQYIQYIILIPILLYLPISKRALVAAVDMAAATGRDKNQLKCDIIRAEARLHDDT